MIILDTNVLSALMMPERNEEVLNWADLQPASSIWTTSVNLLEIRSGVLRLPQGKRRSGLSDGLDSLLADRLQGRVLPFDASAAERAAIVDSARFGSGRTIGTRDTQIAGIALARQAMLATRNTRDFDDVDIWLINPWQP